MDILFSNFPSVHCLRRVTLEPDGVSIVTISMNLLCELIVPVSDFCKLMHDSLGKF